MKRIGIHALRFAIALYYMAFSAGLVQHHQHRHNHRESHAPSAKDATHASEAAAEAETSSSSSGWSRRSLGIASAASLTSLVLGSSSTYSAHADPLNALIPVGSKVLQQQAIIQRAEGYDGSPKLLTELGTKRIGTLSGGSFGPLQGSPSPFAPKELYYPASFVGEWTVRATLKQKTFPFGADFVLSRTLLNGSPRNRAEQVGDSTSYIAKYLPSDKGDQAIADRGFNLVSLSRSYQQFAPVIPDSIQWDSQRDPTRLSYQRESITADMRPVGPIRAQVYLTARTTEETAASSSVFCASERSRTVTVGTGSVTADDSEIITEYTTIDADTIRAISRYAVYLTPNPNSMEGVLWQQVNGKAVAFYDYELLMERKKE